MKMNVWPILSLLVVSLIGSSNALFAQTRASSSMESVAAPLVNINRAGLDELQTLPRIGKTVAARIVEFRKANGPFETIEELMNVRGVGEKTFLRLKSKITVSGSRTESSRGEAGSQASSKSSNS